MSVRQFITTNREDLFEISRRLFSAVPRELLKDSDNPVIVSVRGTFNDGKKIMADAAVENLLGVKDARVASNRGLLNSVWPKPSAVQFEGTPEYDEYWSGDYLGEKLQITFMNAAWQSGYKNAEALTKGTGNLWDDECEYQLAKNFIPLRSEGGISFIHNSDKLAEKEAWIDIWVERNGSQNVGQQTSPLETGEQGLRDSFAGHSARHEGWARYVRIDVRRPALLESPEFMAALSGLETDGFIFQSQIREDTAPEDKNKIPEMAGAGNPEPGKQPALA